VTERIHVLANDLGESSRVATNVRRSAGWFCPAGAASSSASSAIPATSCFIHCLALGSAFQVVVPSLTARPSTSPTRVQARNWPGGFSASSSSDCVDCTPRLPETVSVRSATMWMACKWG
jgi:hypothetical protein